jgi:hypothetical protein
LLTGKLQALISIKTSGGENSLNYCRLWVLDLLLSYQAGFRWIPDWISQTTRSFSELLDGLKWLSHEFTHEEALIAIYKHIGKYITWSLNSGTQQLREHGLCDKGFCKVLQGSASFYRV